MANHSVNIRFPEDPAVDGISPADFIEVLYGTTKNKKSTVTRTIVTETLFHQIRNELAGNSAEGSAQIEHERRAGWKLRVKRKYHSTYNLPNGQEYRDVPMRNPITEAANAYHLRQFKNQLYKIPSGEREGELYKKAMETGFIEHGLPVVLDAPVTTLENSYNDFMRVHIRADGVHLHRDKIYAALYDGNTCSFTKAQAMNLIEKCVTCAPRVAKSRTSGKKAAITREPNKKKTIQGKRAASREDDAEVDTMEPAPKRKYNHRTAVAKSASPAPERTFIAAQSPVQNGSLNQGFNAPKSPLQNGSLTQADINYFSSALSDGQQQTFSNVPQTQAQSPEPAPQSPLVNKRALNIKDFVQSSTNHFDWTDNNGVPVSFRLAAVPALNVPQSQAQLPKPDIPIEDVFNLDREEFSSRLPQQQQTSSNVPLTLAQSPDLSNFEVDLNFDPSNFEVDLTFHIDNVDFFGFCGPQLAHEAPVPAPAQQAPMCEPNMEIVSSSNPFAGFHNRVSVPTMPALNEPQAQAQSALPAIDSIWTEWGNNDIIWS